MSRKRNLDNNLDRLRRSLAKLDFSTEQDDLVEVREDETVALDSQARTNTVRWIKENCWIRPKGGGKSIRFNKWRKAQKRLMAYFIRCEKLLKPIRAWVLKGRQFGISTLVQAYLFERAHRIPERTAYVVAHLDKNTQAIFKTIDRFYRMLPEDEKKSKPLKGGKVLADYLEYAHPWRSQMWTATATTRNALRSDMISDIHLSEVAFMTAPKELVDGGMQAVPDPEITTMTAVIGESTANGKNYFYERWWGAYRPEAGKKSQWEALFFSWLDEDECAVPLEEGEVFKLDPEETKYAEKYKASLPQMKWARQNRKDKCDGDWSVFNRENPAVPEIAFDFSGKPWFSTSLLICDLNASVEPQFIGNIKWLDDVREKTKLVDNPSGPLKIYYYPDPEKTYVMGGDISLGVGADYTEFKVLEKDSPVVVAHYRSNRVTPRQASVPAFLLGTYYNQALIGIESNNHGITTLDHLARGHPDHEQMAGGYDPVYKEIRIDKTTKERTEHLGWSTRRKNKMRMLIDLREDYGTGRFRVNSRTTLLQMNGLAWEEVRDDWVQHYRDPRTKSFNDDGVISLALANAMRKVGSLGSYCAKPHIAEW